MFISGGFFNFFKKIKSAENAHFRRNSTGKQYLEGLVHRKLHFSADLVHFERIFLPGKRVFLLVNIRGLGTRPKRNKIRDLIQDNNLDFIAIQETKMEDI